VTLYSHRYLPAAPTPAGCPVVSVRQTDVIYYGRVLVETWPDLAQVIGAVPWPPTVWRAHGGRRVVHRERLQVI
jgi:hypothetical protein